MQNTRNILLCLVIFLITAHLSAQPMPDLTVYDPRSSMGIGLNPAGIAGYRSWNVDLFAQEKGTIYNWAGAPVIGGLSTAFRIMGPFYMGGRALLADNTFGLAAGGDVGLGIRLWKDFSLGVSGRFFRIDDHGKVHVYKAVNTGLLIRPSRFLDLGAAFAYDWGNQNSPWQLRLGIGTRPLGNDRFNLGLDFVYSTGLLDLGLVSTIRIVRGIELALRANWTPKRTFFINRSNTGPAFGGTVGIRVLLDNVAVFASGGWSDASQSQTFGVGMGFGPSRGPGHRCGPRQWVVYDIPGQGLDCSGPFTVDCSFVRTLLDLDAIARTPGIAGVLLRVGACPHGLGNAGLVAGAIKRLRAKGIDVVVATGMCGPDGLAAFAGASRLFLMPGTASPVVPAGRRLMFVRDLFNTLGVDVQYVATGKYKTYPLMFTRNSPTQAQTKLWNTLLNRRCSAYVSRVNRLRGSMLKCGPGSPALYSARAAVDMGLADGLMHQDAVARYLSNTHNASFARWSGPWAGRTGYSHRPVIAVIPVIGDIVPGRSMDLPFGHIHLAGAASIVGLLEQAADDRNVAGILLFVDSPGGSLAASEVIHHAIEEVRQTKPVAVLFGNVAASGGYYLSTAGSRIFAPADTVTGSIGVFLLRFSMLKLLSKLGISTFAVPEHRDVNLFSLLSVQRPGDKQGMKRLLDDGFELFLSRVRSGRGNDAALWARKAGAMVIDGRQALAKGLVDRVAGMGAALNYLAKAAGVSQFDTRVLHPPTLVQRIASSFKLFGMAAFKSIGSAVQAVLARAVSGPLSARMPWVGFDW